MSQQCIVLFRFIVKQYLLPIAGFYHYIDGSLQNTIWQGLDTPKIKQPAPETRIQELSNQPSNWHITSIDTAPLLEDILASGVHGNSSLERLHSSNITLNAVSKRRQAETLSIGRQAAASGSTSQSTQPQNTRAATSKSYSSLTAIFHSVFLPLDKMSGRFTYLKKAPVLLPVAWLQRIFGYLKENAASRRNYISQDTKSNQRASSTSKTGIPQTSTSMSTTSTSRPAESIRLGRSRVELLRKYGIIK